MSTRSYRLVILLLCMSLFHAASASGKRLSESSKAAEINSHALPGNATIVANSGSPLCLPTQVQYWVYVSGCNGPYTITMLINGILVTDVSAVSPYTFSLMVSSTTTVVLMSVTAPGCNITVDLPNIITITVPPPTVATLTGNTQICLGGTGTNLSVSFTGNGPFTFTYRINNLIQPAITTSSNPYILHVNPSVTTTYQLNDVTNASCSGTVSLQPVTVTVIAPPGASLAGDMAFCTHADTTLAVDFTGTGPYQLLYAINGVAQPPTTTSNDPYLLPVHTDTSAVFTLLSVQNAVCNGPVSGQATVTVLSVPVDSNLTIECNPVDNSYTVEFDIFDAALPVSFTAGTGTLNGNHFTSDPIHQSQNYQFIFHDAINCKSISVAGPSVCFCVSDAGAMATTDTLNACLGDTIRAVHAGGQALDGDDSLRYILHTAPGIPAGQILVWNTTPAFVFLPGMHPDTIYYISAIAGDYAGNDSIDLADICLSVSAGTPVVFKVVPVALFGSDVQVCDGIPVVLPLTLSGAAPFSVEYSIDGAPQPVLQNISTNIYNLVLPLTDSAQVYVMGVTDQFCHNEAPDTVFVTVNYVPEIANLFFDCDLFTTTYTVTFDIQGGLDPWQVSGTNGVLNGSHFTSVALAAGQLFNFTVSDGNNCGVSQESAVVTCPCLTDAGAMDTSLLKWCQGDTAIVPHNGAQMLDNTDTLLFVLHNSPGPGLGPVLATSPAPAFLFDPAFMQLGVTYYVTAVAGNALPGGGIDFSDPCLSISAGTPVIWNAAPTASMSGDFDICPGQIQAIDVVFTGEAPFGFDYTDNGLLQSLLATSGIYSLFTTPTQSGAFVPVSVHDANCPGTVAGQVDIAVHPIPEIVNPVLVCNPDNLHFSVNFDLQQADLTTASIQAALAGSLDSLTGHFTSMEGTLPNTYIFYASDAWHCGEDTLVVTPDCPCTTDAGAMDPTPVKLCPGAVASIPHNGAQVLDNTDALVFVLHTTPGPGLGTVLASSPAPSFLFDPAVMQLGATYYVSAVAGNVAPGGGVDLSDPCVSMTPGTPVVWNTAPTAGMSGDFDICPGAVQLLDILFTGTAPFSFDYTENGVLQTVLSPNATYSIPTGLSTSGNFVPVSVHDANCPGTVLGHAEITVHQAPEVVNPVQTCNPDNLHFSVGFDVLHGDLATVNIDSGLAGVFDPATGHFASVEGNLPGVYTFYVSDSWHCGQDTLEVTTDCPCVTNAGQINQPPMHVCFGADIEFGAASGQVLDVFDSARYVLCTDPGNLPQSVLIQSAAPHFAFSPLLQAGATYFILAVAGNPLPGGAPDFNDPCFSVSTAIPVTIQALPTAVMSGDTTLCAGSDFEFPVILTGAQPFTLTYTQNGVLQNAFSNQNSLPVSVAGIQQPQAFQLQSIQDQYCSGIVNGMVSLNVRPLPNVTLSGRDSICPGGSAILSLGIQHATLCDFNLVATPGDSQHITGAGNGWNITVSPSQTTVYTLHNVKVLDNGCPLIASGSGKVDLSPLSVTAVAGNYNGYGISCYGAGDGFADAAVQGGFGNVQVQWSTAGQTLAVTDLEPGAYHVTATDAEGCADVAEVVVTEPGPLTATWATIDINCHPGSTGGILINHVSQGTSPYRISINNQQEIPVLNFPQTIEGLEAGPVQILFSDANGCPVYAADTIREPLTLSLDLGPDQTIFPGDSVLLAGAFTGNQPVSWVWSPVDGLASPGKLHTWAIPEATTTYSLTVEDAAGCRASDKVTIQLKKSRRVYIPNVIKAGAAQHNDVFTVYAGPEVSQVNYMAVYDRWGEHLFLAEDFSPNDPSRGWNGSWRGQEMPPGVYVYMVEVAFRNGDIERYSGSVTLVR